MGQLNLCATTRDSALQWRSSTTTKEQGQEVGAGLLALPVAQLEQSEICHTPSPCLVHNWSLGKLVLPPLIGSLVSGLHATDADDHTIYTHLMPVLLQVFFATDKLIVSFPGDPTHLHHIVPLTYNVICLFQPYHFSKHPNSFKTYIKGHLLCKAAPASWTPLLPPQICVSQDTSHPACMRILCRCVLSLDQTGSSLEKGACLTVSSVLAPR